ncbi:MAG: hypothetical protein Q7J59_03855 [Elusimicrobiota bacterium]|nr:hypothetical protein [Elusimicrobiota bacterium]
MGEKIKTEMEETGERLKEFYEKAKVFTKDVSGRISKQAGIQKLNIDLLKLNNQLEADYKALGEKSVAYFKKNLPSDPEIKKLVASIRVQDKAIKSLKAKISRQKKS